MKQPAPTLLNRIDVLLLRVGLAVGAFTATYDVYVVFHGGERIGRNGVTNAFTAIACVGLGLAACRTIRRRHIASGLGFIFTALAPTGLAWLAGMLSALIGVVLIVRTSGFVDLLFDHEWLSEEAGEDAGNADQGGLTTPAGES